MITIFIVSTFCWSHLIGNNIPTTVAITFIPLQSCTHTHNLPQICLGIGFLHEQCSRACQSVVRWLYSLKNKWGLSQPMSWEIRSQATSDSWIYIYMNIVLIISSSYLDMPSKILEFIHMIFTCSLVKAYHLFDDLKRSHFCSSWACSGVWRTWWPGKWWWGWRSDEWWF